MKVSVVIPCYNVETFVTACLGSVEQQSHTDLEVICVDDGSTDGTVAAIERYMADSPLNIRLLQQPNQGAPAARNHGVRHCSGQYIQFLDADDTLGPDKIKTQVALVQSHEFPDMVVGSYLRQNLQGELLLKRIYQPEEIENVWLLLMSTDLGNTCANLFKAGMFADGLAWNKNMRSSQEFELMFQILKRKAHLVFDSAISTFINIRDTGSITRSNLDQKWERYVQLRVDIVAYLRQEHPEKVTDELLQNLFGCIRMLYPYRPKKAIAFYKQQLPKGFMPKPSHTTGAFYIQLFRWLGFSTTEKIRQLMSKGKAS